MIAVAITVPGPHQPGLEFGNQARHTVLGDRSVVAVDLKNTGNVRLPPAGEISSRLVRYGRLSSAHSHGLLLRIHQHLG